MAFRAKVFKPMIFRLVGISRFYDTTEQLSKRSEFPFYRRIDLQIALPPKVQLSRYQPQLVDRLNADWGNTLSCLHCSTGDFRRALNDGRVSLGHIWAEIYSISLHNVTFELGFGDLQFSENFRVASEEADSMDYRILMFFSRKIPDEFFGLESLVTGYLNAAVEGKPFPIRQRIKEFISYRTDVLEVDAQAEADPNPLSRMLQRLLRCFHGG